MSRTIVKDKAMMMEQIRSLVAEGKTVTLTVKGWSMNPFLSNMRDSITLGPWEDRQIRKGCVALVLDTKGNYLIHRIIRRKGNIVTLMGDGNVAQTEQATLENVIAIMYEVERKGRKYTPKSFVWRTYSWIWDKLTPVRRYPLWLWRHLVSQVPLNRE